MFRYNKATVDIRLRSRFSAAPWWVSLSVCLLRRVFLVIICIHDAICKPEVHYVSQHRQPEEPRPQVS